MSAQMQTADQQVVARTEWVEFRRSSIHGTGGYARKFIPKDTYVIEYVGEKITKKEAERRCDEDNCYIFTYDDKYDLDGNVNWNPARWINHSCDANCETIDDDGHIWIAAVRDIQAGEELSFNYCYDLDEYVDHPCQCGSEKCVGYIVDDKHHDYVRRKHRSERARVTMARTKDKKRPA
jgi:SET domain-containing protein